MDLTGFFSHTTAAEMLPRMWICWERLFFLPDVGQGRERSGVWGSMVRGSAIINAMRQ